MLDVSEELDSEPFASGFKFPVPVCFATQSGGTTIDQDAEGGNPFATALIHFSSSFDIAIDDFQNKLRDLTVNISHNHQVPEWVGKELTLDWRIQKPRIGAKEIRTALVLIVSNYGHSSRNSLAGAAWDELRISSMLARHGFSVTQGIGSSYMDIISVLEVFAESSRNSDLSIIYSTGHGCEIDGHVYLIPGDYPLINKFRSDDLDGKAIDVKKIASACIAKAMNVVFFAGCRSHMG